MKKRVPVSDIMTKNVVSVAEQAPLKEVLSLMNQNKFRHMPVMQGQQLSGIVSRTDLNRLTFSSLFTDQESADEAVLDMLNLSQVMTNKPRTVKPEDSIREVAEILAKEEFHALPVVDDQGKLAGIVTTTDVIQYLLEQY
jgi:acetoin utilization protein AcuB